VLVSVDVCRFFVFCFFFQAEDGIRDRNVTGVQTCALPIFGFLNVLAAVDAAQDGARPDVLAQILDSQDGDSITGRVTSIDDPSRVRSVFRSFGTCSIQEPLTDLQQLALVEAM